MTEVAPAMTERPGSLGCYVLPGGVSDPRPGIEQARLAEELGLGAVWIGERYDTKDLPALAGAISQVTASIDVGAAITHPRIRHPMALASMGQTLQSLTEGRFVLGLGRSAAWRWRMYGLPAPTRRSLADTATILRRLWSGETVSYDGPLGRFPELYLPQRPAVPPPPVLLAAIGPKTLETAGEAFDGVILHPLLTPEAVRRSVDIVRTAAERSGRDPDGLRFVATVVAAPDRSERDTALAIDARAAGYLSVPGLGDSIAAANGWNAEDLARYRAHPMLAELKRPADKALSRDQLIELAQALPSGWLSASAASGTADQVAARLRDYRAAGATDIILHGSTSEHLRSLASAFDRTRDHGRR